MNRARTALMVPAVAALVLTAATDARPDSVSSDSESSLTSAEPTQRGREAVFTVTTGQATLDAHDGYLTVESPAFAKKLTLKGKRFREGRNGELYTKVAGMVLCDIAPGTYPVDLKDGGEEEPAESVELTVVAAMDPGNREFCQSPRSYDSAVDRTSETAPDEGDEDGEGGVSLGELAAVIAGTAALSAVLASVATYLLTRRRRRGGPEPAPQDAAPRREESP
ncbi:hypothetical protein AB0F13_14185 [Streptomyces sp. NPDC026206]|uniref:hypothetical protein n=1 Tax=Streptomyces sp. NPDC026206 TaxID=3157089 RepID=UPI0033E6E89D